MTESAFEELRTLLASVHPDEETVGRLADYGNLVLEANRQFNVTGAKSALEISEHIADSLTVVPYLRAPYVDVGSGAGFPAIPLAIVTGIEVTLIESTGKKAKALERFLARLGLNGRVVAQRAEDAGQQADLRERFASGTCRAVAGASASAELLVPFIAVGGVAILQRGRLADPERTSLEDAALVLGSRLGETAAVGGERQIVCLEKDRPTPPRFPRRSGIAHKRPLCS